ncbi:MAG TPA: hypothetical protein DCY35_05715 [Prolixibacteraceae bacterium]|nr:hypothetical protein [Prolixibacteraceae bacterium]
MAFNSIKFFHTAGYLPNIDNHTQPGPVNNREKEHLRCLAKQVLEISNDPIQEEKRRLWRKHNALGGTRPLSLIFPEDAWPELLTPDSMQVADPFWRQWEWYLEHLVYRHKCIDDDFVIEPDLFVDSVVSTGNWGLAPVYSKSSDKNFLTWDPPIKNPEDIEKLRLPELSFNDGESNKRFNAVYEIFGDLLPVRRHLGIRANLVNLIGEAVSLRGSNQLMMDIYDRPEWLHKLMSIITEGVLRRIKLLESLGRLDLNNRNHYTDSGGLGYSNELPSAGYHGGQVQLKDLWGFGTAQEMANVSPAHHKEFVLDYQMKILECFGLNAYGCCDSLTHKFAMVKNIPRLRRISVSPWCDLDIAVKELENRYIYSWKPNPSLVVNGFNEVTLREYVQNTLKVAENCVLEIILKDLVTVHNRPDWISGWAKIVRDEVGR